MQCAQVYLYGLSLANLWRCTAWNVLTFVVEVYVAWSPNPYLISPPASIFYALRVRIGVELQAAS